MKRNRKPWTTALFLITAVLMLFPLSASAKTVMQKKIKTRKEYNKDGILVYESSYKYDSKGNTIESSYKNYNNKGEIEPEYCGTTKRKLTYWKGSRFLKSAKSVTKNYTYAATYNKQGLVTKAVYKYNDGRVETLTYKSSGGKLKSYVCKDGTGRITEKGTYDKYGNTKSYTVYNEDGTTTTSTFKSVMKNGILRKRIAKYSDWGYVDTYDSKGHLTKSVETTSDGKTYTYTYKNKYKKNYLMQQLSYREGEFQHKVVYTYTSKSYQVEIR